MRVVLHLSDLHFGCVDQKLVRGVLDAVDRIAPDLIAVSGDLTQRARSSQFRAARRFLGLLPAPQIVVPGNHDVPLYNVVARLACPLRGFISHVTRDLRPLHSDDEIAVLGADTTRSITIKDGGFRQADVQWMSECLGSLSPALVKVVVCHHPFDAPSGRVGRLTRPTPAADAMTRLIAAGADVFLTGHLHRGYTGGSAHRYRADGVGAVIVEAGTATSTRTRGEPNSFNVLRIDPPARLAVERHQWNPAARRFECAHMQMFPKGADGWESSS